MPKKAPIVLYVLPFMVGIALQSKLPALPAWLPLALFGFLCALGAWAVLGAKGQRWASAILFLCIVMGGYAIAQVRQPDTNKNHYSHFLEEMGDNYWYEVRLTTMPEKRERTYKVEGEITSLASSDTARSCQGKVMLFIEQGEKSAQLEYGDKLLVYGNLRMPSGSENPRQFNYRKYLFHKGIYAQGYVREIGFRVLCHESGGLIGWTSRIRGRLMEVIRSSAMPEGCQAVAEALVLGWRNDIDPETKQHYRDSGIMHLLCVSGLHVGIVAMLIGYCLFFLGNGMHGRRIRGLIQLIGVWLFVLLSGMSPSTQRAAVMFSFVLVGQMLTYKSNSLNALATSALVLLIIRPGMLFDVGFQLSYAAVLGIVTMQKPLSQLIPFPRAEKNKVKRAMFWLGEKMWGWICLTTVAQLFTLPFSLYYYHQFPLYFFIANLTVVPLAGFIVGTTILMMLCSWSGSLFNLTAKCVSAELGLADWVTRWVSTLPGALQSSLYFDGIMAVAVGLLIFIACMAFIKRNRAYFLAALTLLALIMGYFCLVCIKQSRQKWLVIYSANRRTAIEVVEGRHSWIIADSITADSLDAISYQRDNLVTHLQIQNTETLSINGNSILSGDAILYKNHFLRYGGTSMGIVDRQMGRYVEKGLLSPFPFRLTYLLICQNSYSTIEKLTQVYSFDTLIIGSDNSWRNRDRLATECKNSGIPSKNLAEDGGMMVKIRID